MRGQSTEDCRQSGEEFAEVLLFLLGLYVRRFVHFDVFDSCGFLTFFHLVDFADMKANDRRLNV